MTTAVERSFGLDDLPGTWHATPREHPEAPSSDPVTVVEGGEPPPFTVYDLRQNVRLEFGVAVEIYDVHGEVHIYPREPMGRDDVLLRVFEESGDRPIRFGNRTRRVHLHGNTVGEIRNGRLENDAIGIVIHTAAGVRKVLESSARPDG